MATPDEVDRESSDPISCSVSSSRLHEPHLVLPPKYNLLDMNYINELDGAPMYIVDDMNSDDEPSDPELYSSSSMTSGSAETLMTSEVHEFFREVDGRMFPSDEGVAINLPTDSAEIQRCEDHHWVFKMILRSNYWGPVEQVLAPSFGNTERKRVLDIITVAGSWVQEMARQFPHVDFVSVDNVPMTSHIPRANITFEVYDLYNGVAAPDESYDIVHLRQATSHFKNPKDIIRDIYRVLKPGGLFLFGDTELECFDYRNPNAPAHEILPGLCEGLKVTRDLLARQGVNPYLCHDLPRMLSPDSDLWASRRSMAGTEKSMGFRNIRSKIHVFPGNTWPDDPRLKEMGRVAARVWQGMWRSMEVPFQMLGLDENTTKRVIKDAIDDIDRTDIAIAVRYYTVYAFKL